MVHILLETKPNGSIPFAVGRSLATKDTLFGSYLLLISPQWWTSCAVASNHSDRVRFLVGVPKEKQWQEIKIQK